MFRVNFTPAAREDLLQIWLYLQFEADEDFANRFVDQIEEKCINIARSPLGYQLRPELMADLRSFPFKAYIIFYVPTRSGIEVYRVLHSARDIDIVIGA